MVVFAKVWTECHDVRHSKSLCASVKGPSTKIQWKGKPATMRRAKERGWRYADRRTRKYTKTMCLLSISGRTRWGFYESLGRARTRRSVVVYSRKESGPVAQMILTPSPASPFRRTILPTCTEIYGNSLFASFKSFRIILLPPFLLPPASKPTLPPTYHKFLSFSFCYPQLSSSSPDSIFLLFDTNEYICTSKYKRIQV